MSEERFSLHVRSGDRLACTLFAPDGPVPSPWPLAILFHGLASSRMNEINSALAPRLITHGMACVLVDLSGHGESTGDISTVNIVRASEEICDVVNHLSVDRRFDKTRIALLGNSFSGAASILAAAKVEITAIALKAPACDPEHIRYEQIGEEGMKQWEQSGSTTISPGVELHWSTIEMSRKVDVYEAFRAIDVPVTVWQGTADEVIPADDWKRLEALCDTPQKRFVRIEGADHRISGEHLEPLLREVEEFFRSHA